MFVIAEYDSPVCLLRSRWFTGISSTLEKSTLGFILFSLEFVYIPSGDCCWVGEGMTG